MIDLSRLQYRVVVVDESGNQYNIKNFIKDLGWEENENEIAVRSSFQARNDKTSIGYLSGIIKPGCLVCIFATDGESISQEVARGYVEKWNPKEQNSGRDLYCTNYDELYKLQKSQDNIYFPAGTGTQSAIQRIFKDWGIPAGVMNGPNAVHAKLKFNNQYLSDILLDLLDDAVKKGEEKCIIRAAGGKTDIIPRGSNQTVYVFREDNTKSVSETRSISDLVTRVKIIGQADDDGNHSVEAVLSGLTQYGIRQRIYTRGSDESLGDAKSAAQEILDTKGNIQTEISVDSPDVPFIRKGDLVYLMAGSANGPFYVKSIRHDVDNASMSMDLEPAEKETVLLNSTSAKKEYHVGDVVDFHGGNHYVSSYQGARGFAAKAGKARVTNENRAGAAHPWHLIHEDGSSNVYGWVDDGTFS